MFDPMTGQNVLLLDTEPLQRLLDHVEYGKLPPHERTYLLETARLETARVRKFLDWAEGRRLDLGARTFTGEVSDHRESGNGRGVSGHPDAIVDGRPAGVSP